LSTESAITASGAIKITIILSTESTKPEKSAVTITSSAAAQSKSPSSLAQSSEASEQKAYYASLKLVQLRELCRERNLKASGSKAEVIDRLLGNNDNGRPQKEQATLPLVTRRIEIELPLLEDSTLLLSYGLKCAGFDEKRQANTRLSFNIDRFAAHFGTGPKTVRAMLFDLKQEHPHVIVKHALMTLYFLKTYVTQHIMAGIWGYVEDFIGKKVKRIY